MNLLRTTWWSVVGVIALTAFAGCAAFVPVPAPPPKVKPPIAYEPLVVRNSCFVESVHLYDRYRAKHAAAEGSWVRVLQWGNQDDDFNIGSGHAIALLVVKGQLWAYDVSFGFFPVDVPVDRRADLSDVSPKIFSRYPQFRPVFATYRDDYPQRSPPKRPKFLFYHPNADVRDATRVASELGRTRPVKVVEFNYTENGQALEGAAAVFVFGGRLCIYFPRLGTQISRVLTYNVDDLERVRRVVSRLYPTATNLREQPGGYALFPPRS
jgi:hypothetical protein